MRAKDINILLLFILTSFFIGHRTEKILSGVYLYTRKFVIQNSRDGSFLQILRPRLGCQSTHNKTKLKKVIYSENVIIILRLSLRSITK